MDLAKLNPWNWFKKADGQERDGVVPVRRAPAGQAPEPRPGSLAALHHEIDRLVDHAFDGIGLDAPHLAEAPARHFRPRTDIADSGAGYRITVELPGVDKADIRVELAGAELTITAERRRETGSGSFRRTLTLPGDADPGAVRAACKNGVLDITVPRRA